MTGPKGSSAHRTNFRRKWATWLWRVLWQNGYPANFIYSTSAPPHPHAGIGPQYSPERDQEECRPLVTMMSYVAGMSDDIRCVCFFLFFYFFLHNNSAYC